MMKVDNSQYLTPLDIPAKRLGDWEVRREVVPANQEFSLADFRCVLLGGQRPKKVSWPFETVRHRLLEGGGTWMTDLPCEITQTSAAIKGMRGRVLIGGLGLGLAVTKLAKFKSVTRLVVVEKSAEVISLVAPYLPSRSEVITADLFQYLTQASHGEFDDAFFDIWQSDGEGIFFDVVCPLYAASQGKVRRRPRNWNEDVMRGQLFFSLQSRLWFQTGQRKLPEIKLSGNHGASKPRALLWEEDGTDAPWHNWTVPFFQWWHRVHPIDAEAERMARFYASIYGVWQWRDLWKNVSGG